MAAWRWWDGAGWTAHLHQPASGMAAAGPSGRPRLPAWLSVPVVICLPLMGLMVLFSAITAPIAVTLGLVPLAIVAPVLLWLDRVEPEPRPAKVHAFLWGVGVAGFTAVVINSLVAVALGETAAAVVSAPVVEEAGKALAIVWAIRRAEVDSVMDGVVYAGWAALGFAVVEDMFYFATAGDYLVQTFVVRALLSPFAHPLFTVWTGLALGRTVENASPRLGAIWGYAVAVALHAAWNGSLAAAEATDENLIVAVAALGFVVLFFLGSFLLYRARRHEQERFVAWVPHLVQRHGIDPAVVASFSSWSTMLAARKRLSGPDRRRFDALHIGLARLASLHANAAARGTHADGAEEARLVELLRTGLTRS